MSRLSKSIGIAGIATAIVLVITVHILSQGIPFREWFRYSWHLMDGLPYLVQSLVLGTILAGPAIIYLHTGRVFTSRKLSGGNLWVILAIATVPQMLSLVCWCAGSNSPSLTIAAFALWYLPVPIQAITLPIATGLVMFSQMHDASIRPLDRIGIALAGIWSLTVMYQVYAVMRFGIPQ